MSSKQTAKGRNIAHCVPRALIEHEVNEEGMVKLLIPRFRARWMQWLQSRLKKPYIKVNLDEIGSAAWLLIDGNLTVFEIGREMEARFGEKIQPVNERLGLFLGNLKKNKFITWEYIEEEQSGPVEPRS